MPKFRAHFFRQSGNDHVWIGYRSLASMRGSHKDADAEAQANYWAFVCFEIDVGRRIVNNIAACLCECVAGMRECSHCAALCLAMVSFQLLERSRSGAVRKFKIVPHTSYSKTWSGDGNCTSDLTVPVRKVPVLASHYGNDVDAAGTDLRPRNPKPEWALKGAALQSVITTEGDSGSSFERLLRALRRDALCAHNDVHVENQDRRSTGRQRRQNKIDVVGQLCYDELLGPAVSGLEHKHVHKMDETLFCLIPEFEGTPAGDALKAFKLEVNEAGDDWADAVRGHSPDWSTDDSGSPSPSVELDHDDPPAAGNEADDEDSDGG